MGKLKDGVRNQPFKEGMRSITPCQRRGKADSASNACFYPGGSACVLYSCLQPATGLSPIENGQPPSHPEERLRVCLGVVYNSNGCNIVDDMGICIEIHIWRGVSDPAVPVNMLQVQASPRLLRGHPGKGAVPVGRRKYNLHPRKQKCHDVDRPFHHEMPWPSLTCTHPVAVSFLDASLE